MVAQHDNMDGIDLVNLEQIHEILIIKCDIQVLISHRAVRRFIDEPVKHDYGGQLIASCCASCHLVLQCPAAIDRSMLRVK